MAVAAVAVSESKKAVFAMGQQRLPDEPLPFDAPSLLFPYVNSIEVSNHGSAGFSISLDLGAGWEAFGGAYLCDSNDVCLRWSPLSSRTFRWPASVYMLNPPRGTSYHSYSFTLWPRLDEGVARDRPLVWRLMPACTLKSQTVTFLRSTAGLVILLLT